MNSDAISDVAVHLPLWVFARAASKRSIHPIVYFADDEDLYMNQELR